MPVKLQKTTVARKGKFKQSWLLVDAEGQILGRLATRIAKILMGKHRPEYTPHVDTGDYVVIINAEKIKVTGNKEADKTYYSHSQHPGSLKSINFEKLKATKPISIIEHAVKGMLPRGPLGRKMFKKLKIYAGSEHPHGAQQPEVLEV